MNRFFRAKPIALVLLFAIMSMLVAACAGDDGPAGAKGDSGTAGAAGEAGPQGQAGDTGPAGAAGSAGSAGRAGSAGPTGAPGPPGPGGSGSTAGVAVIGSTVFGTGWESGERVSVEVVAADGSSTSLGTATANAGGAFDMDVSGMSPGSVVATGNRGGLASTVLVAK